MMTLCNTDDGEQCIITWVNLESVSHTQCLQQTAIPTLVHLSTITITAAVTRAPGSLGTAHLTCGSHGCSWDFGAHTAAVRQIKCTPRRWRPALASASAPARLLPLSRAGCSRWRAADGIWLAPGSCTDGDVSSKLELPKSSFLPSCRCFHISACPTNRLTTHLLEEPVNMNVLLHFRSCSRVSRCSGFPHSSPVCVSWLVMCNEFIVITQVCPAAQVCVSCSLRQTDDEFIRLGFLKWV